MELQEKLQRLKILHKKYLNGFPLENWSDTVKEEVKNSFTYHSTKIEGLTLSYAETLRFLKEGIIKKGARVKELSDVKNHREVLDIIFASFEKLALNEKTIKELHGFLMRDPVQWEVVDPIVGGPGEYKLKRNATLRPGNEVHEYLNPDNVALAMKEMLERINTMLESSSEDELNLHPVSISAVFHYEFLNVIHPFWDGNGRMARLLTTLILLKKGYPPLHIPGNEKQEYIEALIQSENDNERAPLVSYFLDKMIETISNRVK